MSRLLRTSRSFARTSSRLLPAAVRSLASAPRCSTVSATFINPRLPHVAVTSRCRSYATSVEPKRPLFDKILIANRGEIAIRIMKTARKLGIRTVAVYSEADRDALHVKMADEAYLIGPAASAESYLRMDKIIEVARRSGAQAIHPGYGFLSENSAFAKRLAENDIVFIGPPASAMDAMGSKSEAKRIMLAAGVPCVPGYHGSNQDGAFLKKEADKIGYPVLIKAIKGGGGKGMRIVERAEDFEEMLASSRREAMKSFGDDNVLVEKYLVTPRHVEVQVFADTHGNAVYLFERDCSVQRRHQKIIEEAPAPKLTPKLRAELGEKAVAAAKAVDYVGAGTVEFIMDNADNRFYFMEMNTRLQVEHPVTEFVTNTDLVEWQITVAAGNVLPKKQSELKLNGWSFEARIYAENPSNNFLPDTGSLLHVRTPSESSSLRIETGVTQGDLVSVHYDPMIAKLVVHGEDRTAALRLLRKALQEYEVAGPETNIEFLKILASHRHFIAGDVETGFIKKHHSDLFPEVRGSSPETHIQASLAFALRELQALVAKATKSDDPFNPWSSLSFSSSRLNTRLQRQIKFTEADGREVLVSLTQKQGADAQVGSPGVGIMATFDCEVQVHDPGARVDGTAQEEHRVVYNDVRASLSGEDGVQIRVDIGDRRLRSNVVVEKDAVHVFGETGRAKFGIPSPTYLNVGESDVVGSVKTPMPCKISQVLVKPGQTVEKGTPLIILEAMKMEHIIKSPISGIIEQVMYAAGDLVEENKALVAFADPGEKS